MESKRENCVLLNIYVNCDKCDKNDKKSASEYHKKDNDETCVEINVFVECDKKQSYSYDV